MQYQINVAESTANGRINMSATIVICLVGLFFAVGIIFNSVSILYKIIFHFINDYRRMKDQMFWALGSRIVMLFPMTSFLSTSFTPSLSQLVSCGTWSSNCS